MAVHEPIHDPADREKRVVLNATEARQGRPGRPVLYVLVFGLILAMLAWAAAEFWGNAIDTQTPSDKAQVTRPATEPASENENVVNDNPVGGDQRQTEPALKDPQATGNQ